MEGPRRGREAVALNGPTGGAAKASIWQWRHPPKKIGERGLRPASVSLERGNARGRSQRKDRLRLRGRRFFCGTDARELPYLPGY